MQSQCQGGAEFGRFSETSRKLLLYRDLKKGGTAGKLEGWSGECLCEPARIERAGVTSVRMASLGSRVGPDLAAAQPFLPGGDPPEFDGLGGPAGCLTVGAIGEDGSEAIFGRGMAGHLMKLAKGLVGPTLKGAVLMLGPPRPTVVEAAGEDIFPAVLLYPLLRCLGDRIDDLNLRAIHPIVKVKKAIAGNV